MRKLGIGFAFTAVALAGCSSSAEPMPSQTQEAPVTTLPPQPTVPPQPTFGQEKADFTNYFNLVKGYWMKQGVNVSDTRLVIVEGTQPVSVCGGTYYGDQPGGGYCHDGDTVFYTQSTIEYIGSDAMLPRTPYDVPRIDAVAAHELGHAVQYVVGDTPTVQTYQANPRIYENQADCYAGRAVAALNPNLGPIVTSIHFQYLPGSDAGQPSIYGTTAERKLEFVNGFNGGACAVGH